MTVKPIGKPGTTPELMMVVFEDVSSPQQEKPVKSKHRAKKKTERRIEELEKELHITKENLQITIEEMENSTEELKSTNEELQSTNEELQSTNEELETSKEELQSVNEELMTVNTELEGKIAELTKTNNDMENLLDSTAVSTVFLDNDLLVRSFTLYASKVINLINSDVGRPIGHIVTNLAYEKLVKDAKAVLDTWVFKELKVQTKDGHWYMMRIMPYRTQDNMIDGVGNKEWDIPKLRQLLEDIIPRNSSFSDFEVNTPFPKWDTRR